MPHANILKWPSLMINVHPAKLIQRLKAFNYVAKYSMFTVEVFDVIPESNEKLATTTTERLSVWSRRNGH
jgi:hypothetical protein